MTSIEWLKAEYIKRGDSLPSGVFEDAKEMHKQEIIDAWIATDNELQRISAEQYYQETFVSKGSDAKDVVLGYKTSAQMLDTQLPQTTSDKWKEYQDWLNELPEISDEEIEKGAEDWQEFRQGAGKQSFEAGAKWYREQLKKL